MTDIDVVKKGSRAWLWVLMFVALALVMWFLFAGGTTQSGGLIEKGRQPHLAAAFVALPSYGPTVAEIVTEHRQQAG